MSTDLTSPQSSAPKTPRQRSKVKKKSGPSLSDLIIKILTASKERGGVSLVALKKALAASGYDVARNNSRINLAVKRQVAKGKLTQTKGTGASGSFKISTKAVTKPKKPKAKRKKAKKSTGAKKTPMKSRRNLRSPEKASETAAVKTKRPKRAKRRASKTAKAKNAKK